MLVNIFYFKFVLRNTILKTIWVTMKWQKLPIKTPSSPRNEICMDLNTNQILETNKITTAFLIFHSAPKSRR